MCNKWKYLHMADEKHLHLILFCLILDAKHLHIDAWICLTLHLLSICLLWLTLHPLLQCLSLIFAHSHLLLLLLSSPKSAGRSILSGEIVSRALQCLCLLVASRFVIFFFVLSYPLLVTWSWKILLYSLFLYFILFFSSLCFSTLHSIYLPW